MPFQDIARIEPPQVSATRTHIIAQGSRVGVASLRTWISTKPRSVQPDPEGRGNSQETGTSATGGLDAVMEQLAAVCFAGYALLCGLASPARLAASRPIFPSLAHTHWPGQTASPGWPGSLARNVGGCQCTAGPNKFSDSTRNARCLCYGYSLPG